MPEPLLASLVDAVLTTPGVVRLEPTVSADGPSILVRRRATDGLQLLVRAGTAEVDVSIATDAARPAREVAADVRHRIAAVLAAHGYAHTAPVGVTVLAIEHGDGHGGF